MLILKTDTIHKFNMALFVMIKNDQIRINGLDFSLSNLKNRPDFRPFCSYIFPLSLNEYKFAEGESVYPFHATMKFPFERFAETQHNKMTAVYPHLQHMKLPVQVVFYPETKDFSDALIIVNEQSEKALLKLTTYDENGLEQYIEPDYVGPFNLLSDIIPKCQLECDGKVTTKGTTLTFKYHNRLGEFVPVDFQASVKVDKGYVSHQKIDVVQGIGSFKFIPLGLENGEKVKVQVGIGRYTDVASTEIVVGK